MRKRSRRNAWFGKPRLHAKAARKGHRSRSRRRTRRNAGTHSGRDDSRGDIIKQTTRSLKAGFNGKVVRRAANILAGNVGATFFNDRLAGFFPMVRSNPIFEIGSLLAIAGLQGMVVHKFIPKILNANDILIGGILAGVTKAARTVLPGQFSSCGLGEDMEGLGNSFYATPEQVLYPITPNGMRTSIAGFGAYQSPAAPLIGTNGLGDEAMYQQVQPANIVTLDGMADAEIQREIAMQM